MNTPKFIINYSSPWNLPDVVAQKNWQWFAGVSYNTFM
jgi:hypothetical protein